MKRFQRMPLTAIGVLALLTLAWRVGVMPLVADGTWRYVAAYACLLLWGAAAVWVWRTDRALPTREICELPARPVGAAAVATGFVLLLTQLYDALTWAYSGKLPAPAAEAVSTLDEILAVATIAFGVFAGVYLLYVGLCWLRGDEKDPTAGRAGLLLPTLWMVMRFGRYVLSYAFGVHFGESAFEIAMLAVSLIFWYLLGRKALYEKKTDGLLHAMTFLTAGSTLGCVLSRIAIELLGSVGEYVSIVSAADAFVGLFALALTWYWHTLPEKTEETEKGQTAVKTANPVTTERLHSFDGEA